jgi:hypothetical protein
MPKEIRGVPEPHRAPPGAPGVSHASVPPPPIVRPGKYANGENKEGTPVGAERTDARTQRYRDGEMHRASLRDSKVTGQE